MRLVELPKWDVRRRQCYQNLNEIVAQLEGLVHLAERNEDVSSRVKELRCRVERLADEMQDRMSWLRRYEDRARMVR